MSESIEFRAFGEPASKGSRSGRDPEELRRWRQAVRSAVGSHERLSGPCAVEITFILPEGKMQAGNLQNPHGPDLDNLVKPVFDEIKKGVIRDDGAVFDLHVNKRPATPEEFPGAVIRLRSLGGAATSRPRPPVPRGRRKRARGRGRREGLK